MRATYLRDGLEVEDLEMMNMDKRTIQYELALSFALVLCNCSFGHGLLSPTSSLLVTLLGIHTCCNLAKKSCRISCYNSEGCNILPIRY